MRPLRPGRLVTLVALCAAPAFSAQDPSSALQAHLDTYVAAGRVPGVSAGVVLADGSALALAAGVAERETGRPLAPTDRLLAGSVGKTFVSAVALQLVAEGVLELDAPVADVLGEEPWFERLTNASDLTLRHLLGHTSGLPRYVFEPAFVRDLKADPDRVWDPAEQLTYVLDAPAPFAAGAGFAYADTNYLVAALVLERASGEALYDLVHERLLEPLELGIVPSDARLVPGLVQGYAGPNDPLGLPDRVLGEDGRFCINPGFEWAGGGFATTGGDLARWAHALYAGDVLDAATRAELLEARDAPQLGPGVRYGLGVIVRAGAHGPVWGHSGFMPGYVSEVRHWPEAGVTIGLQVNTSEGRALPRPLGALAEELLALVLAAD